MSTIDLICALYVVGAFVSLEIWSKEIVIDRWVNCDSEANENNVAKLSLMALLWPLIWMWRIMRSIWKFIANFACAMFEDEYGDEED